MSGIALNFARQHTNNIHVAHKFWLNTAIAIREFSWPTVSDTGVRTGGTVHGVTEVKAGCGVIGYIVIAFGAF